MSSLCSSGRGGDRQTRLLSSPENCYLPPMSRGDVGVGGAAGMSGDLPSVSATRCGFPFEGGLERFSHNSSAHLASRDDEIH